LQPRPRPTLSPSTRGNIFYGDDIDIRRGARDELPGDVAKSWARSGDIMTSESTVAFGRLKSFIQEAMMKLGLPESDAITVARLMAEADLQGSDGHGVSRLPQYARRIKAGGFNVRPNIHVVREQLSTALLNGDNGMGHLVMKRAAEMAIEKARATGIAWVSSHFSNHAGPASLYASMPLAHDMIGLYFAVGNANHLPPWGGLDMLLSTNPIAAAIPAGDERPIILDMATTVAAYGKVKTKALRGETMPEGWMIDRQGKPLTDPKRADEGMLLPLGGMEAGYKGYGLAMIIGLLAGTLGGAAMGKDVIDFNHDDSSVTNTGQAVAAINIAAFGDVAVFKASVDTLVRDFRNSNRMPGVERIFVPGERSHETRVKRTRDGIPVAPALMRGLDEVAAELGIAKLA
jgi:L-2-hydroxycarboxylate dehydrogenase (NAD+)